MSTTESGFTPLNCQTKTFILHAFDSLKTGRRDAVSFLLFTPSSDLYADEAMKAKEKKTARHSLIHQIHCPLSIEVNMVHCK